jgi:Tol biopolymer transport system component
LREGLPSIYQKASNGTGQEEMIFRSSSQKHPTGWTSDGKFVLFQENDPKTKWDIWVLPLEGERKPQPWAQTPFNETNSRLSPDSKWIAYTSDESGSNEVYVQAFQTTATSSGGRWQISTKGGNQARWRGDGQELFYIASDGKLMAVQVRSGASFEAGVPKALFELRGLRAGGGGYAVTGDGKKFLVVTNVEEASVMPFTVVLNWAVELNR